MYSAKKAIAIGVTLAVTSMGIGIVIAACGAASPSPNDATQAAEYTAREVACSIEAGAGLHCVLDDGAANHSWECIKARVAADQCICAVRTQYHRDCNPKTGIPVVLDGGLQ